MIADIESLLAEVTDHIMDMVCVVDAQGTFVFVSAASEQLLGYRPDELVGRRMIDYVHPDDRARTRVAAERIMEGASHIDFQNRYLRRDGDVVHLMWSARWHDSRQLRVAVARDVTALERAHGLRDALYRISEAADTAEDLPALFRAVHEVIGSWIAADDFRVGLVDADTGMLSWAYTSTSPEAEARPQPLAGDPRVAKVVDEGGPLLVSRSEAAPGWPEHADWLGVPLKSRGGIRGALVVRSDRTGVPYTPDDRDLLQFVSTQIANAIERRQATDRLHHMAHHDPLTGLPNRALFDDRLNTALSRARRDREDLALLYLDLDDFKRVNDTFGHSIGDALLAAFAERVATGLRDSDTVGRIGGDEFAVLLTNIPGPHAAESVVDKLRSALAAPFELSGHRLEVAVSIGVALYPQHGQTRDALFRHADLRMYDAKANGGPGGNA